MDELSDNATKLIIAKGIIAKGTGFLDGFDAYADSGIGGNPSATHAERRRYQGLNNIKVANLLREDIYSDPKLKEYLAGGRHQEQVGSLIESMASQIMKYVNAWPDGDIKAAKEEAKREINRLADSGVSGPKNDPNVVPKAADKSVAGLSISALKNERKLRGDFNPAAKKPPVPAFPTSPREEFNSKAKGHDAVGVVAGRRMSATEIRKFGAEIYATPMSEWKEKLKDFPAEDKSLLLEGINSANKTDHRHAIRELNAMEAAYRDGGEDVVRQPLTADPEQVTQGTYRGILNNYSADRRKVMNGEGGISPEAAAAQKTATDLLDKGVTMTDGRYGFDFDEKSMYKQSPEIALAVCHHAAVTWAIDNKKIPEYLGSIDNTKYREGTVEAQYKDILRDYRNHKDPAQAKQALNELTAAKIEEGAGQTAGIEADKNLRQDATKALRNQKQSYEQAAAAKLNEIFPSTDIGGPESSAKQPSLSTPTR